MGSEHLLNLQRIGLLEKVPFSEDLYQKMLSTAENRIQDALRKQRNLSDYDGEHITDSLLDECLLQAQALLDTAKRAG